MPGLRKAGRVAGRALTVLLALCLAGMLVLATAQILWRNVFSLSIPHSEELLEWLVLWIAMLGAMAASIESRHITIDALSHVLSHAARRWAGIAAQFFAMSACVALFLISGSYWLDTMGFGETALWDVPRWMLEAVLPLAFAIMAGAHLRHVVSLWRRGQLAGGRDLAAGPLSKGP